MPEHNPDDRVRIKNIVILDEDDVQLFQRTKLRSEQIKGLSQDGTAMMETRTREYQEEFEWNFKDGFFYSWGGKYYWLKPNQEITMSRFLAEHAANHMADYLLTREHLATKRIDSDGVPHYAGNILQNPRKRQALLDQIILTVEEWAEPDTSDFDTQLARQYGNNFDDEITPIRHSADFIKEVDQTSRPVKVAERKPLPPTSDPELQKARDEAAVYDIVVTEKEGTEAIKAKIIKAMA